MQRRTTADRPEPVDGIHGAESTAFDQVAPDYDAAMNHRLGAWLRTRVQSRLQEVFPAGSTVLDLGCGTGEDAVELARRGVRVLAVDASIGMLEQARRKAAAHGVSELVDFERIDLNAPEAPEQLRHLVDERMLDGAYSNFGAVNCVQDRRRLATALAPLVRPGGGLLWVPMSRWCAFETLFQLLRLRPRVAFRRWSGSRLAHDGAGGWLQVDYPSPRQLAASCGPEFETTAVRGLGMLLPPTDLRVLVDRLPGLFRRLEVLDRRCTWPAQCADHFVLEMRRRSSA